MWTEEKETNCLFDGRDGRKWHGKNPVKIPMNICNKINCNAHCRDSLYLTLYIYMRMRQTKATGEKRMANSEMDILKSPKFIDVTTYGDRQKWEHRNNEKRRKKKMQQTQGIMSVVKSFHVIVHIVTLNITWKHKTRSKVEKKSNKRPDIEMKF